MIWLSDKIEFPSYEDTSPEGIIAIGGDLSPERLMYAYQHGIFPWYSEEYPILWHCPPERMVLFPDELKVSKSMKSVLRSGKFRVTENQAFEEVIHHCKCIQRKQNEGEHGTWITDEMQVAYIRLHQLGFAKSIEVWSLNPKTQKEELVGGLYGIELGSLFVGESMFTKMSNASKVAFIHLARSQRYKLIDCQVYNDHLASLGAREISRNHYLILLNRYQNTG
jgi:leucyl/phenylalanyl-tRNA--protein transferase